MRKKEAPPVIQAVVPPVDVEVYSMSKGAERLRALEAEMVAAFEEWEAAQKSCAEREVMVEFRMSSPLTAAWTSWRATKASTAITQQ